MNNTTTNNSKKSRPATSKAKTKTKTKTKAQQLEQKLSKAEVTIKEQQTKLAECQQERQHAEAEIDRLKEKLAEYESEKAQLEQAKVEDIIEQPEEAASEDIAASKATFRIDLYPRQGHYHGKIEHPLTRDKQVLSGLDKEAILEFIKKHLPQPEEEEPKEEKKLISQTPVPQPEEEKPEEEKKLISQPPELSPTEKPEQAVLQEITFQQLKRLVEPGHPLQAHRPFTVFTQLHFPIMPTQTNIDIDSTTYDVIVLATDADGENLIGRYGVSDTLSPGVEDYESKITMSGLAPGKYLFNIYTYAHFARLEDRKRLDVIVE